MVTDDDYKFLLFGDGVKRLNLFRGEEPIQIEVELEGYDDFIAFNGKFYAVDSRGRAFKIDHHSGTWTTVADNFTLSGDKNFLVELSGKLLLVTKFCGSRWFKVYQLDEEKKVWNGVTSLGDGILFLGRYSNFSAPAGMISGVRGNCIVLTDAFDYIFIYHMGDHWVKALKDYGDYLELFRPPLHFPTA